MGAFSNVLQGAGPLLNLGGLSGALIGGVTRAVQEEEARARLRMQQDQAMKQLQDRQKIDEQQSADDAALQKQKLETEAQTSADRRKSALRRAVARQKTLFSAQGLSAADSGSSEAVLLGLYDDSNLDQAAEDKITGLKSAAIEQALAQKKQTNLLQSAQLAEQQRLSRILYS